MAAPKKPKRIADPFASQRDPTTGRVMIPIQDVIAQQNAIAQQAALAPPPIKKHIHDQGCVDMAREWLLSKEYLHEARHRYERAYSERMRSPNLVSQQRMTQLREEYEAASKRFDRASTRYHASDCELPDEVYDFEDPPYGIRPPLTPALREMFRTQRTYR